MHDVDAAYIAGLFDGEGSVYYKLTKRIRHDRPGKPIHNTWVIRMEIAMTDKSVLVWLHEVLGCGTVGPRKVKKGNKPQWRWRCSYRDAYYVCKIIWPFAHVKLDKVQKIIDHYTDKELINNQVINLDHYRMFRRKDDVTKEV